MTERQLQGKIFLWTEAWESNDFDRYFVDRA